MTSFKINCPSFPYFRRLASFGRLLKRARPSHNRLARALSLCVAELGVSSLLAGSVTLAQLVPDNTLGEESSVIAPGLVNGLPVDLVEGGAARGANLFHSFESFNIDAGQRLYFANPAGITDILSRVTGGSVSNINGLLGVDGSANLFLLNPNGIVFGPSAQLDIRGSFRASAANGITFSDGSVFSATVPGSSLLSVSVPLGVQYNQPATGAISNAGALTVGQDLTLDAPTLSLQGQLEAGRNITLQAQEQIATGNTFSANSEGSLTVQAGQSLNLDGTFASSRDMVFRAPVRLLGDASYQTNGYLVTQGADGQSIDWLSPHEQVIWADGDVTLDSYTGPSLHILAGGSVALGDIEITAPDGGKRTFSISDGVGGNQQLTVEALDQSVVDVRAGFEWVGILGGAPGDVNTTGATPVFAASTPDNSREINTASIVTRGGDIYLNSVGDITTNGILNSTNGFEDGGDISLLTTGNIDIDGSLYSFSAAAEDSGNGGDIALVAGGEIGGRDVGMVSYSFSSLGNSGDGGNISLDAGSDILFEGDFFLDSAPYALADAGNGGNISLDAGGDISVEGNFSLDAYSYALADAENGGNISLSADGNIISMNDFHLDSSSTSIEEKSSNGGNIFLDADGNVLVEGNFSLETYSYALADAGNGGDISLSADGNIISMNDFHLDSSSLSEEEESSNGGNISLDVGGDISIEGDFSLETYSYALADAGNGGNISLSADGSIIGMNGFNLDSSSLSEEEESSNGGNISLDAGGDISAEGDFRLETFSSATTDAGNGGNISLFADGNIITGGASFFYSYSSSGYFESGKSGDGGNISIHANSSVISPNRFVLNSASNGVVSSGNGGNISFYINGDLEIGGLFAFSDSSSIIADNINISENGGDVLIFVGGNINITSDDFFYSFLVTTTSRASRDVGDGGNISVHSGGDIAINGMLDLTSSSSSSIGSSGNAGSIDLYSNGDIGVDGYIVLSAESISQSSFGSSSNGGDVSIYADGDISAHGFIGINSFSFSSPSPSSAIVGDAGNGGKISIDVGGDILSDFQFEFTSFSFSDSGGNVGSGGDIEINANNLIPFYSTEDSDVQSPSRFLTFAVSNTLDSQKLGGSGGGGNVTLSLQNGLSNFEFLTLSSASESGTVQIGGRNNLSIDDTRILTSKPAEITLFDKNKSYLGTRVIRFVVGGQGQSGDVFVNTPGTLTFNNSILESDTNGIDAAGNITINSSGAVTFNNSRITTNTNSSGSSGNIIIQAPEVIFSDANSGLFATTNSSGPAGNITLQPYGDGQALSVTLTDRAQITASTEENSTGQGGSVRLSAPQQITLAGDGQISVETSGAGTAGNVSIQAPTLTLQDGVQISSTANATATPTSSGGGQFTVNVSNLNFLGTGGLFAETEGAAAAGSFLLSPYSNGSDLTISFQNGTQISTNTSGSGVGGNINLSAPERITIQGSGRLSSETSGAGTAGNLNVTTGDLTIQNGATLSVSSSAVPTSTPALAADTTAGPAGNININARSVRLTDQASLQASTTSGEGGNINLQVADTLVMRRNSSISTEAGGSGNGGNITATASFIVTAPDENNDIIANAVAGSGGRVSLTANRILGFTPRNGLTTTELRSNTSSDLSASSELGTEGDVEVANLAVDPSQGLSELPVTFSDTSNQIAQGCRATATSAQSEFVVTGRGGLPTSPADPPTADIEPIPWATQNLSPAEGDATSHGVTPEMTAPVAEVPEIVEAQGWVRDANGDVVFVAAPTVASPQPSELVAADLCPGQAPQNQE